MKGCVKCGACVPVCPVFRHTGRESHTARGRNHLLDTLSPGERTRAFSEIFSTCLLCGACRDACPRGIDTPSRIVSARAECLTFSGRTFLQLVARQAITTPRLLTGIAAAGGVISRLVAARLPEDSGLRLRLASIDPDLVEPAKRSYQETLHRERTSGTSQHPDGIHYFTGCLANFLQPEIARATDQLVACCGMAPASVPGEQDCCGMAAYSSGSLEEAKKLARRNIAAFSGDSRPILTSCASCFSHLSTYPELLAGDEEWHAAAENFAARLREFSTFFANRIPEPAARKKIPASEQKRIFYHDPCHLRFNHRILAAPRTLLAMVTQVKVVELEGGPQCCGQGGFFHLIHPGISRTIRDNLLDSFSKTTAQEVVTTCSGCLLQWRHGLSRERVEHLALLLARFLARDTP